MNTRNRPQLMTVCGPSKYVQDSTASIRRGMQAFYQRTAFCRTHDGILARPKCAHHAIQVRRLTHYKSKATPRAPTRTPPSPHSMPIRLAALVVWVTGDEADAVAELVPDAEAELVPDAEAELLGFVSFALMAGPVTGIAVTPVPFVQELGLGAEVRKVISAHYPAETINQRGSSICICTHLTGMDQFTLTL